MKKNKALSLLMSAVLVAAFGCKTKEKTADETIENLKSAIAGETIARMKYAAYARKAKDEGLTQIALLFEATSIAEGIHARRGIDVLDQFRVRMDAITPKLVAKSTKINLEDAIKGESHEIESMYPDFIKTAEEAKIKEAVTSFNYALETEKKHLDLYKDALDKLEKKDVKAMADTYTVCPKCGNTFPKNGPKNCDICGEAQSTFIIVK